MPTLSSSELVAVNVCIIPPKRIVDLSLAACKELCEPLKGTPNYYVLAPISSEDCSGVKSSMTVSTTNGPSSVVSSTPQHGIPHCTLYQLFAKKSELPLLTATVKSIVADTLQQNSCTAKSSSTSAFITCEGKLAPGPVFGKTELGHDVHVPSVVIKNEGIIKALHEAVVNGLRKFHFEADGEKELTFYQSTFNSEWPASEASANWTLSFEKNASFDKYFPHITLGSCQGKPEGERLNLPTTEPATLTFTLEESAIVVSEMANNCCCYKVLEVV